MDTTVLAALLEYSPNPTWLADCDGRCIYANQELREATALSEAQLGDLNWLELVTQEDRQMSFTLWQEAWIHHQPYRARFFLRTKDCARVSAVDAVGTGHIAPDGSEVWLFTAVTTQSGKALPPIETNLQVTLNALPTQAWYARASGALSFVNGATADYLGLPSDHPLRFAVDCEAPWDAHLAFLHPEDYPTSSSNWAKQIQTGRPRDDQFRILGADGKYRWFLTRAEPLRDSDGQVRYWVGVNIDIDDKKRAREALDEARERIGRAATQSAAMLNSLRPSLTGSSSHWQLSSPMRKQRSIGFPLATSTSQRQMPHSKAWSEMECLLARSFMRSAKSSIAIDPIRGQST
jgi:PAS domain S-box-containing protein